MSAQGAPGGGLFDRRGLLRLSVGAGVTMILTGCANQAAAPTSTATQSTASQSQSSSQQSSASTGALPVPRNQSFVMDAPGPFQNYTSFNPFWSSGREETSGYVQFLLEPLFYLNLATGNVSPWLATKYTPAPDFLSGVLALRSDVTWSDGSPMTADDVAFSFQIAYQDPKEYAYGLSAIIKSVTATGAQTVQFTFKTPQPRFAELWLYGNAFVMPPIVPKHVWQGQDPLTFTNNPPVTTAPWVLYKTYPSLGMFIWQRNENYWGKKIGNFPQVQYIVVKTASPADAELADFERGAIDAPYSLSYPQALAASKKYPSSTLVTAFPNTTPFGVMFNCGKAPLDNPQLRKALTLLFDPSAVQKLFSPPTTVTQWPWADLGWFRQYQTSAAVASLKAAQVGYNPTLAGQILDQQGMARSASGKRLYKGQPLSFRMIDSVGPNTMDAAITQQFTQAAAAQGITISFDPVTVGATFVNDIFSGEFDMRMNGVYSSTIDPLAIYSFFASTQMLPIGQRASSDWPRLSDPTLNGLVAQLSAAAPGQAAIDLYNQAFDRYVKDYAQVSFVQDASFHLFSGTVWKGWPTDSNLYNLPFNTWGGFLPVLMKLAPA